MEIVTKEHYQTTQWSGGTTTELLIYPKTSKYSDRNFIWRISSAKVDIDESLFTNLPGISRQLIIMEGKMLLEHEDRYQITLLPFEQDHFMGDWTTRSFGKATDFNLMLTEGCSGYLEAIQLKAGAQLDIVIKKNNKEPRQYINIFYVQTGDLDIVINCDKFIINQNNLFYKTSLSNESPYLINFINNSEKEIKMIRTTIYY